MTFAGIDFKTGAVDIVLLELDTDAAAWHRVYLKGSDAFEKARSVRDLLPTRGRWQDAGVVTVAIEEPKSRFFKSIVPLYRIQGAILSTVPADMPVIELAPTRWKQAAGLRSNAPKDEIDAWVIRRFPPAEQWTQDARDAYAIAYAARAISEKAAARQGGAHLTLTTKGGRAA